MSSQASSKKAEAILRAHGGVLRTSEAVRAGIHPRTLYAMYDAGTIVRLSRGLYRLASLPTLGNPDLVSVALRVPHGVVCLVSALAFHEITTQIPHEVWLALTRDTERPRIEQPPVRIFRFKGDAFTQGIETHDVDGVDVRVYSPEKTLADCFKFRNRIGLDVAVEALNLWRQRGNVRVDELMGFARTCRVERVMRPYVEALL